MKGRIYQIMQSVNMTQRDFASALGISPSSLSSIFNGHTSPTNNMVQAIHRRFPEISITWLMFGEGEMHVADATDSAATPSGDGSQNEGVRSTSSSIPQAAVDSPATPLQSLPKDGEIPGPYIIRETVKYIDKPQRRITEIRVFYDDGTFDTFSGKRD